MRVCLVPHQYPPDFGGVASASERYAQGLLARGHEVLSVCVDRDLPPHECQRGTQQGVACLRIGAHRRRNDTNTSWFESIVAAHAENPFDVIVGRYLNQAAFVAVFTARFTTRSSGVKTDPARTADRETPAARCHCFITWRC